jgi:hypothetical protein
MVAKDMAVPKRKGMLLAIPANAGIHLAFALLDRQTKEREQQQEQNGSQRSLE